MSSDNTDQLLLNLTVAAFVISIVALVLTVLQSILAYLQFDNSEVGRRRCSEEVMGKEWASKTFRKFKWNEVRYQVFFEVPVFYTAPPGITVGPITLKKPKPTWKSWVAEVLGIKEADTDFGTSIQEAAVKMEVIKLQPHVAPIYKITGTRSSYTHTLTNYIEEKDEKWAAVHTAEDEGCSWVLLLDALQMQERISRKWDRGKEDLGKGHSICYLLQRKQRCWDFMPLNATKPFATTTICHLVEIMSMLGLVWTEFDVKASTLSAEGNGYMVKSEYTPGLGILTRFTRLSKATHEGNRIIPCNEVKRLCFGDVPSLFDALSPLDNMGQKLQVGPQKLESSIAQLLPELGAVYREQFMPAGKNAKPLILPPIFQLIGMVAKSVHIPGSRFRRLPNPCEETPPHVLDIAACLKAFVAMAKDCTDLGAHVLIGEIKNSIEHGRLAGLTLDPSQDGRALEQIIHNYTLAKTRLENEKADRREYLPSVERQQMKEDAEIEYKQALLHLLDSLHAAVKWIHLRLTAPDVKDEVRNVITVHFSTLFLYYQEFKEKLSLSTSRERELVAFYFDRIRSTVVRETPASAAASTASTVNSNPDRPLNEAETTRSAVWVALMFNMWSWLFLHEFNPLDKMIERTEFQDSRLPVYIG